MSYTGPGQFERVTRGSTAFTTGSLGLGREQTGTAVTDFTRDDDGLLLALRTGPTAANTYYPLFDGLGSVAGLSDSTGALVAEYRYEPFGKRLSCTGAGCSIANPYQWLGGLGVYLDEATGLYKMGTRYYDPALGRFTQVDPVAGGSANRYDYAFQDPINNADPSGLVCGPGSWGDKIAPDWVFGGACEAHDECYGSPYWVKRSKCDDAFTSDARENCRGHYGGLDPRRYACYGAAKAYYGLLRSPGGYVRFWQLKYRSCRRQGNTRKYCGALATYYATR